MNSETKALMQRAAISTFEELAFMFPISEDESDQSETAFDTASRVDFEGPFKGTLTVLTTEQLMLDLATNMLGEDEAPTADQQRDALGEMANVICGNLLPMMAGADAVFNIGAPEAIEPARTALESENSASVAILLDSGPVGVVFHTA